MITPPPGWTVERTADGLLLAPPGGPARGLLHYAERRRPIRRALDLVRAARLPAGFVETALGAPRRLTTIEGEHAAIVTRTGGIGGVAAELVYGFVFLDDYYAMLEGLGGAARVVEELITQDTHLLGRVRRRRFVYAPPPGWQGTGDVFDARWYPLDYPANPARVLVNPALPATPGLVRAILDRLGVSGAPAERFTTPRGLDGELHHVPGGALFFLHDADFLYSVRADAALDTGRALVDSIEPVPRPSRPAVETFRFWAD